MRVSMPYGLIHSYMQKDWCLNERKFVDGSMVTQEKLLLYLDTVVIPRGNTKISKGKRASGNEGDEGAPHQELSYEGLDNYVKSLISLHKYQCAIQGSGQGPPIDVRGVILKNRLKAYRLKQRDRDAGTFKDRHEGTMFDGYTEEQFVDVRRVVLGLSLVMLHSRYIFSFASTFYGTTNRLLSETDSTF
jgi:hypothetical protein